VLMHECVCVCVWVCLYVVLKIVCVICRFKIIFSLSCMNSCSRIEPSLIPSINMRHFYQVCKMNVCFCR